jgi:negative regulator of flagellin synthesis FlgM
MKIDQIQNNVVGLKPSDATQRSDANGHSDTLAGTQDSVSLSKFATRIKQLAQQADAGSVVDRDRVNAIRQAIADGTYKISSEGIASGMLNPIQQAITKS